jgi:hypothetical protein
MNENIRELALRAGFDFDVHGSADGNFYGWEGRWINKDISELVKLVAKECISVYEGQSSTSADKSTLVVASINIKKRFDL